MSRTQTTLGVVDEGLCLLLSPFADGERHDQLAIGRDRRMIPHVSSLGALSRPTPPLLFFTKLHCSSNSKARGSRCALGGHATARRGVRPSGGGVPPCLWRLCLSGPWPALRTLHPDDQ